MLNSKLVEIFLEYNIEINENTNRRNTPNWDSLNHMNIICDIENKFNLNLTLDEILQLNSIKDIINLLEKKNEII